MFVALQSTTMGRGCKAGAGLRSVNLSEETETCEEAISSSEEGKPEYLNNVICQLLDIQYKI